MFAVIMNAALLLLLLAFAPVGQPLDCHENYETSKQCASPDQDLCCIWRKPGATRWTTGGIPYDCGTTSGGDKVGCWFADKKPKCCCSEKNCNYGNSVFHRQIINYWPTCFTSSTTISSMCGHPDKDNMFKLTAVYYTDCGEQEFGCAIELRPDGETGNIQVDFKCVAFCEYDGCREKDGKTFCCCGGSDKCNDKQLALEGFNKQCVPHKCLRGPNNSPQIVSSLCGNDQQLDAGVSAECQPDESACAVEVQPHGNDSLHVVYSCAKDCNDNYGCKQIDGKTHCCCNKDNCNTNWALGIEAFDYQCRPQQCPQGVLEVECGQEVRAPEWTPCEAPLHLSCSAEVHVESEGTAMTWRCLEKCTGDGCGWEGDVYRCCCSGHTCNSTWMAQLPLDAHCNRTRCIGSIQSDLCSNSHHLISPKEQLLCSSGQEGCGLHIQMDGGSPQLKYSCVSECGKDECQWMGDKYVCCCIGHSCNRQEMAVDAFESFCDGPPTKGQQQMTGFGVALICTVFFLYKALANGGFV